MSKRVDPEQAAELMRSAGLQPLEPYPGSAKKWHCRCSRCGNEVWPRHSSIKQGHGGCNYCAQKASHDKQRLSPEKAVAEMRAAGLEPLEPYKSSKAKWKCRCMTCDGEVVTSHDSVHQGHRCKSCAMNDAAQRRQASNAADAVLVMQGAGLEPLEPYPGTVNPWRCTCLECGQVVTPTHDRVLQTGRGCPRCSLEQRGLNRRLDADEAANVMRAAGLEPLVPYPTSLQAWPCRCSSCGRTVDPSLSSVKRGARCRYCSGKDVLPDEAAEVMRAAGVQPIVPYPGANQPWLCECLTCGRHPKPRYTRVRRTGSGCGYCSGRHVDPDEAAQVMRDHNFNPLGPYPGSLTAWLCECAVCGKQSSPYYANVRYQGSRCAYCQGMRVDPDQAVEIMSKAGLQPLEPYPGANTPWLCRCTKCGNEVRPVIGTIRAGGGCKFCATRGLDYDAPALLYVITHHELAAHKIGIGSPTGYRLKTHHKHGWITYKVIEFPTGQDAYEVEAAVLRWLRLELGLPQALTKRDMPQRGETETVYADDIALEILWDGVRRISAEVSDQQALGFSLER